MSRSQLREAPPRFAWAAAAIATAFAGVGGLIVAGAGPTPIGQIMAVLVGFLILGAGSVLVLALGAPHELANNGNEEWPW